MSVFSGLGDERFRAWRQNETMKASDEMMEAEAMIDSAAESEDDCPTSSPSPEPYSYDVCKGFRPIRPRLPRSPNENNWQPTELTQPMAESQPPMQQTQPDSTPQTQPTWSSKQLTQLTQPETNEEQTLPAQHDLSQLTIKSTQPETSRQKTELTQLELNALTGDFIEIRCIVERLECSVESGRSRSFVELDSMTLVPCSIPIRDLVDTVLNGHGFESMDIFGAKGAILPNSKWQAVKLDDLAQDLSATVGDIFSGIETSQMVLKITLPSFCCEQKLREILLKFLLSIISYDVFTKTNCPLDKTLLDQLRFSDKKLNLSRNKLSAFEQWVKEFKYDDQIQNGVYQSKKEETLPKFQEGDGISPRSSSPKTIEVRATSPHSSMTVFDPFTEITKLTSWFAVNPDPSLTDLQVYLDELNYQSYRHSSPATLSNVVDWFVDARAQVCMSVNSNLNHHQQLHSSGLKTSSLKNVEKRQRQNSSCDYDSKSKESFVPRLPNKNAVYIVQPLLTDSSDSEAAEVVQPTNDGDLDTSSCLVKTRISSPRRSGEVSSADVYETISMKSDENHNTWANPSVVDFTADQATDLSLVKRSDLPSTKPSNWKPVSVLDPAGRHPNKKREKDTNEYELSSGSSSPKAMTENTLPASFYSPYPLTTIAGLPFHPSQFHAATMLLHQQRALYNFSHPVFGPQPYETENVGSPGSGNEENDRRKRSRVFIDPTTEIPLLEQWYLADTHPSAQTIEYYTEELNKADYRQRFPKLEPKNVQLWFKNHRAKMKRLRMEQVKSESVKGSNGFLRH